MSNKFIVWGVCMIIWGVTLSFGMVFHNLFLKLVSLVFAIMGIIVMILV
jgi:hypothetical protein